jgi:hypothetical protein
MNNNITGGNKDESEQTSYVCETAYSRILRLKLDLIKDVETVYTPQSFKALGSLTGLHALLQKELSDVAISKIEGLVALYLALSEVSSLQGFTSVLTLYAKTHSQASLVSQLKGIAEGLFSEFAPQDSSARPDWLNQMITGLTDWKLLTTSPSFKKVSRVLSLMVTLGVIDSTNFTLGNFEIFAIKASEKQVTAIDFIDALIETTVFFAEGAYQCFLQGSIRPLFFSSSEIVQIEEQYIEKCTEFEYARNGNLEKFEGKSESQFDKELTVLIEKLANLYKTMPSGTEKKIVQTKWEALSKMSAEFAALRVKGGLRKAPFCVKIYGDSGVGKSTFADLTMATVLKANGKPCTSDYIVTLNEKDKHMNTYRSYVTGIKIDDYGSTRSAFWESAPSDWIIKICNNIREAAVMADLANKGKVSIEPSCLTITTNIEDLHAGLTTYNQASILRRAHVHVDLKTRPEYTTNGMLDSQKVIDEFGSLEEVNDIWLIDVKKPVFDKQDFNNWETVHSNISIHEFLSLMVEQSRNHFRSQDIIVDSFKEPSNIIQFCGECDKLTHECECKMEPHFGERIAHVLKTKADSLHVRAHYHSNVVQTKAEDYAVSYLLKMLNHLEDSPYCVWTNWIPTQFLDNGYVKGAILFAGEDFISESVSSYVKKYMAFALIVTMFMYSLSSTLANVVALGFIAFFLCYYGCVVEAKKESYFNAIVAQNGSLHAAFMSARDKHVHYACGLLASLGVLYGVAQVVRALRKSFGVQGSLRPRSVEDVQNRDREANVWAKPQEIAPLRSEKSFTNHKEATRAMRSLLGQMVVDNKFSVCFMVKTGQVMVPKHFLPKETTKAVIHYCKRRIGFILNPKYAVQVGVGDFVLLYVPNTGPLKDSRPFFLEAYPQHPLVCDLIGIDAKGEIFDDYLTWNQVPEVHNGYLSAPGSHYKLGQSKTFAGMCMSVITRGANRAGIVGFHTGGVTGTDRGCGMSVLRHELVAAEVQLLKSNESFMCGTQASEIPEIVMGKNIAISGEVHPKCPSNFIESGDAAIEVYGTVIGRSTYSSEVVETPISKAVEEVTGVKNKWGPPRFKDPVQREDGYVDNQTWKPWYASLEVCSQPSIGFDPEAVEVAMEDYYSGLKEEFQDKIAFWGNDLKPMSEVEIVSGIDGKRFCDAMNSSTSMGYPLNAKKTGYLVDLEPTESNACPRTFVPEIWDEYYKAEALWDEGVCSNQIFGTSLKDEPTPIEKEKVRAIEAAPIVLQLGSRKYYLPIARFLSMNPLLAECAVGINAHGIEWNELAEFISMHGEDRIIAGDYKKYDLTMPAQLIIAAFRIMIKVAQLSGNYTAIDIKRMEAIAFEVCTPLVAYNGTLMRFMGTNPSGQNMTVYINSIVNSLLHRLAFNDIYDAERRADIGVELGLGRPARFRDVVNLLTYGDDAMGSVMEGYDEFNHVSMANYLAANGMQFTMPDKTSDPRPFMNVYDVDFLKRKIAFNPDLGVFVGLLDENSIFKSLHSILKSKAVEPKDVARMNMEGALREWFFYGEKHFEMRREQMSKVATKCRLTSEAFDKGYWDRVEEWKLKYEPHAGVLESPEVPDLMDRDHPIYCGEKVHKNVRTRVVELFNEPESVLRDLYNLSTIMSSTTARITTRACEFILDFRGCVPVDVWDYSDGSVSTIEEPEPIPHENELIEEVKAVLGKPTAEEYVVVAPQFGKGDLVYVNGNTIMVIECKRVIGRHQQFAQKVVDQARKYGAVLRALKPNHTVYSLTYTEFGFQIVDVQGDITFPEKFAHVLDNADIRWA